MKETIKEIWKPIKHDKLNKEVCKKILVSNKGRIKSLLSDREVFLKLNHKSIAVVTHYGKRYYINVKHQVYINFIGEINSDEIIVAKDGNNENPHIDNLQKMTKSEFMKYCSKKISPLTKKEAGVKASITNFIPILGQIELYEKLSKQKVSEYELANRLGISRSKLRSFKDPKKSIAGKLYKKGYFTQDDFKEFKERYKKEYKNITLRDRFFTKEDTQIIEYLKYKIKETKIPATKRELEDDLKKLLDGGIL